MSCQVVKRVGRPSQHVQACAHAVRVVPQCVHPVLLRHNQGVGLSLLDEPDQEGDCGVLQGDGPRHPAVRGREVEEQVDCELPQHLVLRPVQLLGEETAKLLYPRVGRGGEQEVNIGLLKSRQIDEHVLSGVRRLHAGTGLTREAPGDTLLLSPRTWTQSLHSDSMARRCGEIGELGPTVGNGSWLEEYVSIRIESIVNGLLPERQRRVRRPIPGGLRGSA